MAQLTFAGRRPLWIALLVGASVAFSLGFACAVPLAAFAAIAALTLSRRDAFALVGAVWLANQIAGFAVHHYPVTASTLAWGRRAWRRGTSFDARRALGERPSPAKQYGGRGHRVSGGLRGL
ncbi:MAG: hypothetical protein M3178_05420 [Pseudomonadota bacterium]|nr:hypothetical protein [Pseudomonadota bacterium]